MSSCIITQSLITTIIAGHTHRPVFENLSLTERMVLEGRMGRLRGGNKARKCDRKNGDTIPNSDEFGSCPHISPLGHVPLSPRSHISSDRAYYNTGSCVHPRCITGIEIAPGADGQPAFTLIKWGYAAQGAGRTLAIEREELER
ncbi:MAG: hypothetical protein ACYDH8_16780 [Syntrophales bacterium]